MKDDKFQCALCRGVFDKANTDEEAEAELEQTFPGFTPEECGRVCEDCFQKFFPELAA